MKEPRVRHIIDSYRKGQLKQVYEYLSDSEMHVDPNTWSGQIKTLIEEKKFISAIILIESINYKFKTKTNEKE